MAHLVETMAWVGDKPWHGLGNELPTGATPEQMMDAAGLDWHVRKAPLTAQVGGAQIPVHDFYALVRDTDNSVLGHCGKEYIPIQNKQIFEFFKRFTDVGHMRMETAGSLKGGRHVWALAKFSDGFSLPGGDKVQGYLLFSQPHEYGKAYTIKFTPTRVVCNNTITLALKDDGQSMFRMAHTREFDQQLMAEVDSTLGLAQNMMNDFQAKTTMLSETPYEIYDATRYIAELFQPELVKTDGLIAAKDLKIEPMQFKLNATRVYDALERSPGSKLQAAQGTYWGLLNAVTYVVDHKLGKDRDNALHSAWFGDKATLKRRAFDRAVAYAEHAGNR